MVRKYLRIGNVLLPYLYIRARARARARAMLWNVVSTDELLEHGLKVYEYASEK